MSTIIEKPKFLMTTPVGRASYVYVFKTHLKFKGSQEMQYSCTQIFDATQREDIKQIEQVIHACALSYFKRDRVEDLPKGWRTPLRNNSEKSHKDGYQNPGRFLCAKNSPDRKPRVIDQLKEDIDPASDRFYAGCYCHMRVEFWGYDVGSNMGVGCSLLAVQKVKDGPRLAGVSVDIDRDFDTIEDDANLDDILG